LQYRQIGWRELAPANGLKRRLALRCKCIQIAAENCNCIAGSDAVTDREIRYAVAIQILGDHRARHGLPIVECSSGRLGGLPLEARVQPDWAAQPDRAVIGANRLAKQYDCRKQKDAEMLGHHAAHRFVRTYENT